jgi:hypothetical protein
MSRYKALVFGVVSLAMATNSFSQIRISRDSMRIAAQCPVVHPTVIVDSSSPREVVLEVVFDYGEPAESPSECAVGIGLVPVAPSGQIVGSVEEAIVSRASSWAEAEQIPPKKVPAGCLSLGRPVIWRDLRVVDIRMNPCWQEDGDVLTVQRAVISVTNVGGTGINEKTRPIRQVSPTWDRLYARHILNYTSLDIPTLDRGSGKRYIVVSRGMFHEETPVFEEWKTQQGYGVEIDQSFCGVEPTPKLN